MNAVLLHGLVPEGAQFRAEAPPHDIVQCAGFNALTSPAPTSLEDLSPDALADLALRHNALLVAYGTDTSVLPLRFGTAFSSAEAAATHLFDDAVALRQALQVIGTVKEYAIRLCILGETPEPAKTESQSGRDFLARGRLLRDHRRNLTESRTTLARQLLSALRGLSWQITTAGPPKPDRLLDAVLLLPPSQVPALTMLAESMTAEARALGLDLQISGPWPAYSFEPSHPPLAMACHGN